MIRHILKVQRVFDQISFSVPVFQPMFKLKCERFEPRSHFKRMSLIVRVNVVLNRTVVVDTD